SRSANVRICRCERFRRVCSAVRLAGRSILRCGPLFALLIGPGRQALCRRAGGEPGSYSPLVIRELFSLGDDGTDELRSNSPPPAACLAISNRPMPLAAFPTRSTLGKSASNRSVNSSSVPVLVTVDPFHRVILGI